MDDPADSINWSRWHEKYGPRLLLFARQQTRSPEDAEDVFQSAMVRLWRGSRNPGDGTPDLAQAFTALRRSAIDLARRNTRREIRETKAAAFGGERDSWFISAIEDREREMILKAALGRLVHEQQELITLKIWGELTFKQIAKVLDISPNTAASRYRYALGNLRHALDYTAS